MTWGFVKLFYDKLNGRKMDFPKNVKIQFKFSVRKKDGSPGKAVRRMNKLLSADEREKSRRGAATEGAD